MLTTKLGYRPPSPREVMAVLRRRVQGRVRPPDPFKDDFPIPMAVLHADPLVCYSGIVDAAPLGVASLLGRRMRTRPAWFLLSPTWTAEDEFVARQRRYHAVLHRFFNPHHSFVFLCNTEREAAILQSLGEAAFVHNKTTGIDERLFRPLAGVATEFDAIYNAQLASWKRHELTLEIPRCAFLFYRSTHAGTASTRQSEAALIARHAEVAPGHVFINDYDAAGFPLRLPAEAVNRHLNRASVGLCLSEEEGPMFACAEYLLSGLAALTTPNKGGRDFWLDDEFFITVAADPRSVAEGVAALQARAIPREHVRARTMRRIDAERARFIGLVNAIHEECGIDEEFPGFWPLKRPVIMEWMEPAEAMHRALAGTVDDLYPDTDRA